MSKSGKSAYFRHIFANNFLFLLVNFLKLFQRIKYPYWIVEEILVLLFFCKHVLDLNRQPSPG